MFLTTLKLLLSKPNIAKASLLQTTLIETHIFYVEMLGLIWEEKYGERYVYWKRDYSARDIERNNRHHIHKSEQAWVKTQKQSLMTT